MQMRGDPSEGGYKGQNNENRYINKCPETLLLPAIHHFVFILIHLYLWNGLND